ncbi:MAG: PAS domain S-box protein [Verrucomicrobia bacterium]|nr:PAS domain S-box protein [Verrucomicrobiota bacterium]
MRFYQFSSKQKTAIAGITGVTALVGWAINGVAPTMFSGWDVLLLTGGAAAASMAVLALRTIQRLWNELERRARALEISEERHRLLLEQASDAILVFDAKTGMVIEANRCACEVLGWQEKELVGQRHTVLYTTVERDSMRRIFDEHVKKGGIVEDEIPVRHRNGEIIPMHSRSSLVTTGARRYVQAILRDLRPRMKAEAALRRSETQLREIFERAPVAIAEEDFTAVGAWLQELRTAGVTELPVYLKANPEVLAEQFANVKVTGANPAALRAAGASDLETYAQRSQAAGNPEILKAFQLELEAIWEGRSEVVCDLPFGRVDGSVGHSVMHWSVTKVDDCLDLRRVVVVFSDLSDLRATEARLREVEDRWELAVKALNVGIFEKDFVAGDSFVSDRWKEILGFEPNELTGGGREWQARIHPDDSDRVLAQLQAHLRGETAFYRSEYRMLCKNGQYKWIEARGRAFFDEKRRPQRLIGAHTDISESKKADAAMRASEARYRELFERTPVAILEEDFSDVGMWLRARGVMTPDGLESAIAAEPGLLREGYRQIRLRAANRHAISYLSAASLGEMVPREKLDPPASVLRAFHDELIAILERRDEVNAEVGFTDTRGRAHYQTVRWSVARMEDGALDLGRVLVVLVDITEIKNAEENMLRAEERWQLAVRGTQDGIWEYNLQTREGFYSERWKIMLGYEPHEIGTGREELLSRIHPDDLTRVDDAFQAHCRGGTEFFHCEFRLRCKDGSYKWILSRGQAMFDPEGNALRVLGSHTDITQRKTAEDALRDSETRYRVLFEHSPVAIVEQDYRRVSEWQQALRAKGVTNLAAYLDEHPDELAEVMGWVKVINANQETVRMARAGSKKELLENLPRVFTPDSLRARREAFLAVWDGRNEIEGEITLHTLDDQNRRVYFRWWLPQLGGREGYESTQLVLVDLTDIRSAEAALAAERERLRVTLRAMAECLLTTDTEGVVQFMNEAAEKLTGWPAGTAIGRGVEQVCVLRHEKTRANVTMPVARSISEHRVVEFPLHSTLVNRQGVQCVVDGRCAPMHDLVGQPIGAVVVFRDVTERARLEAELLRSSKLESVGILAGGIAHDFNNILTVVMGNVTLAMLDSGVMAAAGRWLTEAEHGVLRARDLTQQLLTFAKGGEPVRKTVQLPEVVREVAEFALHGSKAVCEFKFDPDLWAADVDKGQIGQVVQNLVINAVQAMPEGGQITIAIHNEQVTPESARPLRIGKYLRLEITDSGLGIRAEHLQRIFDPYFTTKQSGSGLGLATVYSIVRRHQGHIDVESELGQGTTFLIWLPAVMAALVAEPEAPAKVVSMSGRVLFMDDEETICTVACTLLERLGFTAVSVSDGKAAVDAYAEALASNNPFRLVIMDLTVPGGMGGREAMEQLLKIDPRVRAIVSSGYSSDPVLSSYRAHGFRGMVPKPYKLSDLARTIRGVLEGGA